MTRMARFAAVALLLVWVGPVSFDQIDGWGLLGAVGAPRRASAESNVIPAGEAVNLERGTLLRLRLRDGTVVEGRFLERALLDSAQYVPRFHERSLSSGFMPLALGETLTVALVDGGQYTAPFSGYGELALLLGALDRERGVRVPFEFTRDIRRANGEHVQLHDLIRAFHQGQLPSAEALVLTDRSPGQDTEVRSSAIRVPVEDIRSATAELESGGQKADVAGGVLLGVLVSVVLFILIIRQAANESSRGCESISLPNPMSSGFISFTQSDFDRERACFVGDGLATIEPWDDSTGAVPALASAAPGPGPATAP